MTFLGGQVRNGSTESCAVMPTRRNPEELNYGTMVKLEKCCLFWDVLTKMVELHSSGFNVDKNTTTVPFGQRSCLVLKMTPVFWVVVKTHLNWSHWFGPDVGDGFLRLSKTTLELKWLFAFVLRRSV